MKRQLMLAALVAAAVGVAPVHAEVTGVTGPAADALFHSKDAKLERNKQAAYHIQKDLLESNQWASADKWLTKKYLQHNPNASDGLDGVIYFFTKVMKREPTPVAANIKTQIVAVSAEGDYVTIVRPYVVKDPKDPSKTYTTTWFDTWRFVDGKADEHWDSALKN